MEMATSDNATSLRRSSFDKSETSSFSDNITATRKLNKLISLANAAGDGATK